MEDISNVLNSIRKLFRESNETDREYVLERLYIRAINNDTEVAEDVIRLFHGGMGSFFNDVVLYANDKPLIKENNKLSELKSKLFEECLEVVVFLRKYK